MIITIILIIIGIIINISISIMLSTTVLSFRLPNHAKDEINVPIALSAFRDNSLSKSNRLYKFRLHPTDNVAR